MATGLLGQLQYQTIKTALKYMEKDPEKKGNIRDYATINQLICLSNMESLNAILIEDGLTQRERLLRLNKVAIHQMQILEEHNNQRLTLQ